MYTEDWTYVSVTLAIVLCGTLGVFIGFANNSTLDKILIKNEIAEYRIDPKTGKKTFYVFTRKELTDNKGELE